MAAYLDLTTFKARTLAPATYADAVEAAEPGWVAGQLEYWSRWLDARLAKRYVVPFDATSPPVAVVGWLARLVTHQLYLKRGVDPTDAQVEAIRQDMLEAREEIKEAADAEGGLFELPLKSTTTAEGVTRGTPLGYSEADPYTWSVKQREAAADE